ncbi:MAG: hypothetical protein GQ564_09760 [Bacteroidales bacterium]|nr:hypothetical protein [Bacteroidales bacterium]
MFKLKSKFITVALVLFGILFSITSCNKDEVLESTETNSESTVDAYITYANQSVEQYLTSNTKLSWIDWIAIGIADATGACDGAILAAPLWPPWGSIGGGLIVGAAASYTTYINLGGSPPPPPPPPPPSNYCNFNNAFEYAGICHNLALWECVHAGLPNDLHLIYTTIEANITNITFGNLTPADLNQIMPFGLYSSSFTLNNPYPIGIIDEYQLHNYMINYLDPIEAKTLANYFYNMFLIGNLQNCISYSIMMENYITSSTLPPNNKETILIGMSVFRNSINFWN